MVGLISEPAGSAATQWEDQGGQMPSSVMDATPWMRDTSLLGASIGNAAATYGTYDDYGREVTPPEPTIPKAAANEQYGIPGRLSFPNDVPESVAQEMNTAKHAEVVREDAAQRRPGGFAAGATGFAAGTAAMLLDPVDAASLFIPVLPEGRIAEGIAQAGLEGLAGRTVARVAAGASSGAIQMGALAVPRYALSQQEQADYGASDALWDTLYGAVLGGAGHGLIGLGREALGGADDVTRAFEKTRLGRVMAADPAARMGVMKATMASVVEDRPVDVEPLGDVYQAGRPADTAAMPAPPRIPFGQDFPDVVIQQPYGSPVRYTDHPDYAAAKAGDPEAAVRFVDAMVDPAKLDELRTLIGASKPTVVAVHAEEAAGRNAIPQTYAEKLSSELGLPLDDGIIQVDRPQRTGQRGEYRLSTHSEFDGPVQPGRDYLITDDNVTQGGTLADLRSYIESRGGHVVGATTLTGSRGSEILAARPHTLAALRAKVPGLESRWQRALGHDFSGLTQGEANYLLRSPEADALGDRVIARAQEGPDAASPRHPYPPGRREDDDGEDDGEDGGGDQGGGVTPPSGGGNGPDGSSQAADAEHPATPGTASPPAGMSRSEYMQWVHQQNLDYINKERPYFQKVAAGWIDPERLARGEHWLISVPEAEARLAELDKMESPTEYSPEAVDAFYGQYLERQSAEAAERDAPDRIANSETVRQAAGGLPREMQATSDAADQAVKQPPLKPGTIPPEIAAHIADLTESLHRSDVTGLLTAADHAQIEAANSWMDQARLFGQGALQAAACVARGLM